MACDHPVSAYDNVYIHGVYGENKGRIGCLNVLLLLVAQIQTAPSQRQSC